MRLAVHAGGVSDATRSGIPAANSHRCRDVWYMYGMTKTTVYLPPELKRALTRIARERRCSEAEVLRDAVTRLAGEAEAPLPRVPLFRATGPSIAEDVDRALGGFGTR
jgi:Arc/MetJ-type ribon-helix-helix transcriptional regulator